MADYSKDYHTIKSELLKATDRYYYLEKNQTKVPKNAHKHFTSMLHEHLNQLYLNGIELSEDELNELHEFVDSETIEPKAPDVDLGALPDFGDKPKGPLVDDLGEINMKDIEP